MRLDDGDTVGSERCRSRRGPERAMDLTNVFRLDGKVAVVTGASYGLGVLFAEVLASAGADVVVTARSVDKLQETCTWSRGLGGRGHRSRR